MEYQQVSVSAAAPFSKKLSNGGGYGGKHVYDGVFSGDGGAVKLGTRVEDYREIFGGSAATASSIPILDVPELNENSKVSSVGAQRVDYAKIFGGFGDADFGLPHEELFAKPKKVKSYISGTRSPAEVRSRNAGSKHSNVSKEQKGSSPEASFQSIDGVKQFNVSYNKSSPGNKNGTNGMTQIAQLHAVPGYTFLVDEITPSKMAEGGKPALSVVNDAHLNANVDKSVKEDTTRRKAVSGPQPRIADTNSFRSPSEFQKKSSRTRSISNEMPFEIGLGRGPPLSSPTNSSYNNGGTNTSKNSKFEVSRNNASRGADLPAFSDEEMDANSDAAASAAALRKAIEEAQMKIKIAKELMERKKEGLQNRAKTSFNNSWKAQKSEVKTAETLKKSCVLVDREMHEKEDTAKQEFTDVSEGNVTKASQLTPDFEDEKKPSFANNAARETDNRLEEAEDWESTEEFFEAVDYEEHREMLSEFDQADNAEKMASYDLENKWREKMTAEEKIKMPEECHEEVFNKDKVERELNSVVGAFQWNLYAKFVKPSQELRLQEENEKKMRISSNHEETDQTPIASEEWEDCETKLENLHQPEENAKLPVQELEENEDMKELKDAQDWVETEKEQREGLDLKEMDNRSDEVPIMVENDRGHDQIYEKKENVEGQQEEWERVECEMKQGGWILEENEEKLNDLYRGDISGEDGETEGSEKTEELMEDKEILKKSDQVNETEKREEKAPEGIETERIRSKSHQGEEDEKTMEVTEQALRHEGDSLEMAKDANEQDENENLGGSDNTLGRKINFAVGDLKEELPTAKENGRIMEVTEFPPLVQGTEKGSKADGETEGGENTEELMDDEEILKKRDQMNETEKREEKACEGIETEMIRLKGRWGEEDEKTTEVTEQALRHEGDSFEMAKDENENLGGNDNVVGCKINFAIGDLKADILTAKENGRIMEETEFSPLLQGTEKESKEVEDTNSLEQQNCVIAGLAQGFIGLDSIKKQTADVTEAPLTGENGLYFGENDINFEDKQNGHRVTEYNSMSNEEKCIEDVTNELDDNGDFDICEPDIGMENDESEKSSISSQSVSWSSDDTGSLHDPEYCVDEASRELGENNKDVKESEVTTNHEKEKNSFESSDKDRWVDNGIGTEASYQPFLFEGQGKTTEITLEEELNQSTSKKEESRCKNPAIEVHEAEDNLQREVDVEKKQFRKKEEVKEREIEKEKERIAVERAIREARERAFAEARERAAVERAAAEAHQRLKAEVRERPEKAPLEANNKLAAEKASIEAKLKAERAAVERATAEARQRALEKALSEKAASNARNQVEKSAAERFSSISKDNGMNSRDRQYNDPGSSSSSRYPGSSNHDEGFNGGNGESAQRSKATLERHQRTAERAAKALAEKNMRDLLAQKEQAERNRLAETLDADFKRWSSGKERNLRALLSTLQYILGPDSGWQPIPLTELVSSTAVKKAYRKATLFVHPDKLQQRGASIQKKYTCEKVFDLLKDAWNKFSAEER